MAITRGVAVTPKTYANVTKAVDDDDDDDDVELNVLGCRLTY